MVLSSKRKGAGDAGALPRMRSRWRGGELDDGVRGSQALEFAMVVPAAVMLVVLLLHAGILAADLVTVQGLAREAARIAVVADDAAARGALADAAGRRPVALTLDPAGPRSPGTLVTVTVRLHSTAFSAFGAEVWLPGTATMRVENR